MTNDITYTSWRAMVSRCNNPNDKSYKYYGGAGVSVIPKWLNFSEFLSDMGARPSKGHTIDRIDPAGDYCVENCRWVTRKTQSRNTKRAITVEHNGETKTLADWCDYYKVGYHLVYDRLFVLGWGIADALQIPADIRNRPKVRGLENKKQAKKAYSHRTRLLTWDGETLSVADWSSRLNWSQDVIRGRLKLGWSTERIFTTPHRNDSRLIDIGGIKDHLKGWSNRRGIPYGTVCKRIRNGKTVRQALGFIDEGVDR